MSRQDLIERLRQHRGTVTLIVLVSAIILGALAGVPGRLANPETAERLLEKQGFSEISLVERHVVLPSLRGCAEADAVRFDFEATNAAGRRVEVEVCQGWPFKGATIRGN